MKWTVFTLSFMLVPALAGAEEKLSPEQQKANEMARQSINRTGPQIDACNARYQVEQPNSNGSATITIQIIKGGKVASATVKTELPQNRSLKECLVRIAKTWTMPPPNTKDPEELSLSVPIYPGLKFKIYGPGEKPRETKTVKTGFIKFSPKYLNDYDK